LIAARSSHTEKRLLQGAVAVAALVPVTAGIAGILDSAGLLRLGGISAAADSHLRYLSGLLLAIGLGFWSTIPGIERKTARLRLLAALVVTGGLARALSLAVTGMPSPPMLGGLAMELAVTPLLALWQARIARRAGARN
jgi:hypothetical protein